MQTAKLKGIVRPGIDFTRKELLMLFTATAEAQNNRSKYLRLDGETDWTLLKAKLKNYIDKEFKNYEPQN